MHDVANARSPDFLSNGPMKLYSYSHITNNILLGQNSRTDCQIEHFQNLNLFKAQYHVYNNWNEKEINSKPLFVDTWEKLFQYKYMKIQYWSEKFIH